MMDRRDDFDLNDLLNCCRRELAFRRRCYPRWVEKGTLSEKKAARELELMQQAVDYFIDAVFRRVTGQGRPPSKAKDWRTDTEERRMQAHLNAAREPIGGVQDPARPDKNGGLTRA